MLLQQVLDMTGMFGPGALTAAALPLDKHADRSHLCSLTKQSLGFDIIGLRVCPTNESHVVVWGLTRCSVVVFSVAVGGGVKARKIKVDLSFGAGEESNTVLLAVHWVPGEIVGS